MLDVVEITLDLGGRRIFDQLCWRIPNDAKWALVGRNGAGKTTLLRLLAGELRPDSGDIVRPAQSRIGYLPQEVERQGDASVIDRVLSGAPHLLEMESKLERHHQALIHASTDEAAEKTQALAEAQNQFELLGGPELRPRAFEVLKGLGFSPEMRDGPLTALSGGWWMRVELARLLVAAPDYLLLDEPTNHLDHTSCRWLAQYLRQFRGALVIVSHDRHFLDASVKGIVELTPSAPIIHEGNYEAFLTARATRLADQRAAKERYDSQVARNMAFVERFGAKATKASQAQSRLKAIERLEPPPELEQENRAMHLRFAEPVRSGKNVWTATNLAGGFEHRTLFSEQNLSIQRGDKVALLGPNGVGKSTLLKILAGVLPPLVGECSHGHLVTPYYFAQHQLESLRGEDTVLESLTREVPEVSEQYVRGILGAFLFSGASVYKKICVLSGGEKSRVALARMLVRPTNFLLLDEPTNHLDLDSKKVLQQALIDFTGTVVLISHDEAFLRPIINRTWSFLGQGQIAVHAGGIDNVQAQSAARAEASKLTVEGHAADVRKSSNKESFVAKKQARRDAASHRRQLQAVEQTIEKLEQRLKQVDQQLVDPTVFADVDQARSLMHERADIDENLLPESMRQWEKLAAELEGN